jgi:hypothetical protein
VEGVVIDGASVFGGEGTGEKCDHAGMILQVAMAFGNHVIDGCLRRFLEGEEDDV